MKKIISLLILLAFLVLPFQGGFSLTNLWPDNDARVDGSVDTMDEVDDFINTLSQDIHERVLSADGETVQVQTNWTATGKTCADLGTVTTADINGGTIDGATLGGASQVTITDAAITSAAATSITGVTTFTAGGDLDIGAYEMKALTLESDQATGTAPLTVASTTKVTNLNADTIDGINSTSTDLKPLGAWSSKSNNTTYQATTDGFVVGYGNKTGGATWATLYTDGSNPPTTVRTENNASAASYYAGVGSLVKKDDYYKVYVRTPAAAAPDNVAIFFIPLGD